MATFQNLSTVLKFKKIKVTRGRWLSINTIQTFYVKKNKGSGDKKLYQLYFSQVFSERRRRTLFMDPKQCAVTPSRYQTGNSENVRECYVQKNIRWCGYVSPTWTVVISFENVTSVDRTEHSVSTTNTKLWMLEQTLKGKASNNFGIRNNSHSYNPNL